MERDEDGLLQVPTCTGGIGPKEDLDQLAAQEISLSALGDKAFFYFSAAVSGFVFCTESQLINYTCFCLKEQADFWGTRGKVDLGPSPPVMVEICSNSRSHTFPGFDHLSTITLNPT